jgi:intracellular septation protein
MAASRIQAMQMLIDFLPIIVFFVAYFTFGIYWATAAIIAVLVLQIGITYAIKRTVSKLLLISGGLAVVLGGITLALREPIFIQLKLTVVEGLFALVFLGSHFVGDKTIVERIMGHVAEAPQKVWRQLNLIWVVNFAVLAIVNVYVVYNFDMDTWTIFKTFGTMGLTLLTAVVTAVWIAMHAPPEAAAEQAAKPVAERAAEPRHEEGR